MIDRSLMYQVKCMVQIDIQYLTFYHIQAIYKTRKSVWVQNYELILPLGYGGFELATLINERFDIPIILTRHNPHKRIVLVDEHGRTIEQVQKKQRMIKRLKERSQSILKTNDTKPLD